MSRDFFSRLSLVNQLQPSLPGNAGNQVHATTVDLARRRREPGGRRQPARRDIIRVVNAISAEQRPTRLPALKHFRAFLINPHKAIALPTPRFYFTARFHPLAAQTQVLLLAHLSRRKPMKPLSISQVAGE